MEKTAHKTKKKIEIPHILVLIFLLNLVFSALSYIIPGGEYQLDDNKRVIAGTFSYVGHSTVSPWKALLAVRKGITDSANTIALLLVCGGSLAVVMATGCFEEMMNYGIYKLEDKSIKVLVPSIIVLMSLLGAFAGNDSMIAFVTVGLVICPKLGLDRICAMAMFYLGYLIGQGASLTSVMLITIQSLCDVAPLSGMQVRIIIWVLFTGLNAAYCTRYALKIAKDPSKSITGVLSRSEVKENEIEKKVFPLRSALNMGGICVVVGFAKVIGTILNESKMVNTIAENASRMFGGFGPVGAVVCIFVFILMFNMLIPSGLSKAAILLPLVCPIGDVLGVARDVIALTYSLGDSLTNTLTPLSGPLVGALGLAGVDYTDWIKYSAPLMGILAVVAAVILSFLSAIAWVA